MSNVISMGITGADVPPEQVLKGALERGLTEVVVIGYDKDGKEFFAFSEGDGRATLWMLEICRHRLLAAAPTQCAPPTKPGDVVSFRGPRE